MKINILAVSISCLVASVFISCDDEAGDTVPPVINLIAPAEGAELHIGSAIYFDMELFDNEMLLSYKVEIHHNFAHHEHGKSLKSKNEEEATAFFFHKAWDVSGQKNAKVHHHEIEIPSTATPGDYHLMVYCSDAAGNESHVARNIVLM